MKSRDQILANLKEHIIIEGFGEDVDGGIAELRLATSTGRLRVVVSWGDGWDHASVSKHKRVPTWDEMCFVKDMFFNPDECVIQYHPPQSEYVNIHPNCLHLWRQQNGCPPLPPSWMV